jgi:hypothetical protein
MRVRLGAPRLDARLAAGEDPTGDRALGRRSAQLKRRRVRAQTAAGIERLLGPPARAGFSASVPVHRRGVEIALPAIEQLAKALRTRESVRPRGVALTRLFLTDESSPLYRPASPDALYEAAREALLALGPDQNVDSFPGRF